MRWGSAGPLTKWLAAVAAVAVLAVAGWGGYQLLRPDHSCGQGVTERGPRHECTGVTDGSVVFAPALAPVFGRIQAENTAVKQRGKAVTIAMMIPMAPGDAVGRKQVLTEVQGAYLAQYRANHLSNDEQPAIRLLLANPGRDSLWWRPVADQLAGMTDDASAPLRAVMGFDVSTTDTEQTIRYLTRTKGIPVVEGSMTADDIANSAEHPDAYPGLARVTATNSDQAAALAHFTTGVTAHQSLVVEDIRRGDNYLATLRTAFEARTKGAPLAPEQFRSPADVNTTGGTPTDFRQMVPTICDSPAKVIYFVGRPLQLRLFVNALGERGCTDHDYTVITGSGASTLSADPELHWDALGRGVTVEYAADAHPAGWAAPDAPRTGGSAAAFNRLGDLAAQAKHHPVGPIGPVDLTGSRTITEYDSAFTAISAVRNTATGGTVPSLATVADAWLRMHGAYRVDGAGGWICLDNYGNPYDKAVSVVRLDPATHGIRFVGIGWPTGAPPAADCTAAGKR